MASSFDSREKDHFFNTNEEVQESAQVFIYAFIISFVRFFIQLACVFM